MTSPKISVVMPVYNCERYLPEAIESILSQTFDDFELIIINDGSSDRSAQVIASYLVDQRVVYEDNGSNRGLVFSLNRGIEMASADIIARMDGDDVSLPERFAHQYRFLKDHPDVVLVGSSVEQIDSEGRSLGMRSVVTGPENIRRVFFYYGPHRHPTIMVKKEAVQMIGGYRAYAPYEDIDLYFRLILSGMKTDNLPAPLLLYRIHGENFHRHIRERARTALAVKKSAIEDFGFRPNLAERLSMYMHYVLDLALNPSHKHQVETVGKWLVDHYEGLRQRVLPRFRGGHTE